jgi:hypothetical protein
MASASTIGFGRSRDPSAVFSRFDAVWMFDD